MASTFQYPGVVSRTLDPSGKSLRTIVAMHDRQITDADINLLQDLQTQKLSRVVADHGVTSGGTTYSPFQFNTNNPLTFFIPAFDVIFNGEIISVQGQQSPDLTLSRIQIPSPPSLPSVANLAIGDEDARLYIVFLEIWYAALNPITGKGYYQDPLNPGPKFFFPFGGILPDPSNAKVSPDDSVDPFQGLFTTERAQIQWRLNVQRVALDYDFSQAQFGFFYTNARVGGTNGSLDPGQIVYGQASLPTIVPGVSPLVGLSTYQFTNMANVNGDTGLWRCGDGNINNSLGTMDGYSYALPVGVAFQRNTSNFNINTNIFGCANPNVAGSGTLATRISGRLDSKLADQVFQSDVIDTRTTVSLSGFDMDDLMRKSFVNLIMGNTNAAVSRFSDPSGNKSEAVGSQLDYYVVMGPNTSTIATTVGVFDGFTNGFSSDTRTFNSAQQINISQKATGSPTGPWVLNDSFVVTLPQASAATITTMNVTALVSNPALGTKTPAALLQGQINISGLGSKSVTVTFAKNLTGSAFDPGVNNLYVTLGVQYPAGGASLKKIPSAVAGGSLFDNTTSKTMPAFGISEYQVQAAQPALSAAAVWAINPEFSDILLGTKIWIQVAGSTGTVTTLNSISQTTFIINTAGLNGNLNGLYVTRSWDLVSGNFYNVINRVMTSLPGSAGIQHTVTLSGAVDPTSTVVFSILAQNTAQLAFNAPVMGATQIEETVLFGQGIADANFPLDPRVVVESVSYNTTTDLNTIVFGAKNCLIKGISGDDTIRFIWTKTASNLIATPVTTAVFGNGTLTLTVSGAVGTFIFTNTTPFMLVGSILPAFDPLSVLSLQIQYVPYQGEGVINRDYDILHSEDNALITTNGTGAAPIIGLADVYPYNREFPISAALPSQPSWHDETLTNSPLATFFDSNFVAMQQNNVEHTFLAPLHTNDFIPPINKDIRRVVRFTATGSRGFAQAIPHLGFAIAPPTARTVLGQNLQSTQASITLFVDNVNGIDTNTGLTLGAAKKTIASALAELPPVLRHPCTIILRQTGVAFNISQLQSVLEIIALGDGDIRPLKQYALGNLSRVIQDEGRLVISREATATNPVVIDATGFSGFGDGPTSAFYIENSRVILSGLQFQGFTNPAITAYSSDIDMVDCAWTANVQAGAYVGCDVVIFDRGSLNLPASGTGHVFSQSNVTSSGHILALANGVTPQSAFYVGTRGTTMVLQQHNTGTLNETNISATTVVATAQLNSSISVDATFQTAGNAVLSANSVLLRTVAVDPFQGGVVADTSSSVVTQVG